MKDMFLQKEYFINTRKKFNSFLKKDSLVILHSNDEMPRNGDQFFKFRQNSNMLYLTGLKQEKTIFCFYPDHPDKKFQELVFIVKPDKKQETWEGHKYSIEEAHNISGVENIHYLLEFDSVMRELLLRAKYIYLYHNEYPKFNTDVPERNLRFSRELINNFPGLKTERLAPLLLELRLIKEKEEVELMKKACEITGSAFRRVLKTTRPKMIEYQIEAEISYEFRQLGAAGHAYAPIVASGKNACVLHYVSNDSVCKFGDLVLMDFGAEYRNYAADCSRTIPVNGKFTKRQKECYESVLRVFKKAKQLFVPGNTINIINNKVNKWMEDEMIILGLFSKIDVEYQEEKSPMFFNFYMHGASHFIGLDVHDPGAKDRIFEKGMVLTCEPGLYIEKEGIGIRIENDILVDDRPVDLMGNIPIEVEEIELLMKQ
ncbi:MAG: aminopeptidase P family protein [Bacteroidota bacterium]|nr:aminopeptidase P family protein [Bacteroidota bacterium]